MDYEEKYKAALERAKQFSEKPYLEDSAGIVEYIFPELVDSEDSRIRKEIRDFICWATDKGCITKEQVEKSNSWLAWLEKQGEQKPFDYEHATIQQKDFAPKFDSLILSNSSNIGNSEDLESSATNYAQDKYLPVQTAQAFKAGAAWQRQQLGSKEEK